MYNRTGSLFQYKFKRKEIENDEYLRWLIYYIHNNPLKSQLSVSLEEWEYSSYKVILYEEQAVINKEKIFQWFSGRDEFIKFHQKEIDEKIIKHIFE